MSARRTFMTIELTEEQRRAQEGETPLRPPASAEEASKRWAVL